MISHDKTHQICNNVCLTSVNRRFLEFRSKKSHEILGTRAPKRPSYRDLYKDEHGRKDANQRSFAALVQRHKQERDDLFKAQGMYTPLLPIISEETQAPLRRDGADAAEHNIVDDDDATMTSARSLPPPTKTPVSQLSGCSPPAQKTSPSAGMYTSADARDSSVTSQLPQKRKRKVGSVLSKHNGLYLSKAKSNDEGITKDTKFLSRKNSKRVNADDLSSFSKLPPILSCSAENIVSDSTSTRR